MKIILKENISPFHHASSTSLIIIFPELKI